MIHMMNCTPHQERLYPQPRRHSQGWRALLGTFTAVLVLALFWAQPVSAQEQAIGPVYALPGTLSHATNRSYDTIFERSPPAINMDRWDRHQTLKHR